jgi:hypothetical protein
MVHCKVKVLLVASVMTHWTTCVEMSPAVPSFGTGMRTVVDVAFTLSIEPTPETCDQA